MPHTTNRRAFRSADGTEPLVGLYMLLVAIELALKDALQIYDLTHDLEKLAKQHFGNNISSALEAQITTFQKSLSALVCTFKGNEAPVSPANYPGLRYLRLQCDGYPTGVQRSDLDAALVAAKGLLDELARAGVTV